MAKPANQFDCRMPAQKIPLELVLPDFGSLLALEIVADVFNAGGADLGDDETLAWERQSGPPGPGVLEPRHRVLEVLIIKHELVDK